jgi:hypothetical protein
MQVKANLSVILEVPEERVEEILKGNISAFLGTIYTPDENTERGKWWVEGECIVENGKKIIVK